MPKIVILAMAFLALTIGAAKAGPAYQRILDEAEIRLGVRSDAPPFASLVDGRPEGFSIDLCAEVAAAIRSDAGIGTLRATLVPVGTQRRFEALEAGEIDLLCGATTATLERRERVDFSIPTFLTGVGAVMRADAPALLRAVLVEEAPAERSATVVAEALKGARLGLRRDTTAETWLAERALGDAAGVEVLGFDDHEAGLAQVRSGEIDAYLADHAILTALVRKADDPRLKLSAKAFTHEPYTLPKGDSELRLAVDRALSRLYRSGRIVELFERHFGTPTAGVRSFYAMSALPE